MPNHHIVGAGEAERGYEATQYGYDKQTTTTEEPFVHGAATVGEATGRGGDTQRGLKSRHIQFLYVLLTSSLLNEVTNAHTGPSVVLLEQVSLSGPAPFLPWSVPRRCSWLTWP